ncbi:MAG: HAMP domain-containing protein [Deltaproteobacteria bacterium]|nr:HAMP domain-containing protein [Deltaproteobacteria bacterium]
MAKRLHIPIRFKVLITLLAVITVVVSLITFNMAKLFHADKEASIRDLTSVIAANTAEEARSLLSGYREKLQVFGRIMFDGKLPSDQKVRLLAGLFEESGDFVAVTFYEKGKNPFTLYDANALGSAGLSKADVQRYRLEHPIPMDRLRREKVFVENSTLAEKLPTLTMVILQGDPETGRETIAEAVVRLDSLLRLARRSVVFDTYLVDSRGILLARADRNQVGMRTPVDWTPDLTNLKYQPSMVTTLEYSLGGEEKIGGFGRVEFGELLVGVEIPKTAAYLTARDLLTNLIYSSILMVMVAAFLSFIWADRITHPVELLSKASRVVAQGKFDVHVQPTSRDEIGELAESFNQMTHELKSREDALSEAQNKLIQSEKMAAFGQLGAGIAHEVKNPLAGILGYAQISLRKMDQENPLHKNLLVIEKETKRCKTIIDNLLRFARQEKVALDPVDPNTVVEDAVAIVEHQLNMNKVKLEKDLALDLPRIKGNSNQLQQVLMNLFINGQQSMEGKPGSVKVSTRLLASGQIELRVSDTGPGMDEEIRAKIFEPFFTTKPSGKGTGLGLSVSYGIIKDHQGEISVESELGKGTTFFITIPVHESRVG